MYGKAAPFVVLVFSNARTGDAEALAQWYQDVHAVDSIANGPFNALRRYEAVGSYDAQFLAIWEGDFTDLDEAKAHFTSDSRVDRDRGRVTPELEVVWISLGFLSTYGESPPEVVTLSVVEGTDPERYGAATYLYTNAALYECGDDPCSTAGKWADRGVSEAVAPHGPFCNFEHPENWPPRSSLPVGLWVSHWRPILSLRADQIPRTEQVPNA